MIRNFKTLEVVCNNENGNSERLAYRNNKTICVPLMNKMHLSNSADEYGVFDLFKNKITNPIELSKEIDSVSLVLCDKTEYISSNCSMTETTDRTTIAKIGTSLFSYTKDCDDVILVSKEDLSNSLNIFNSYARIIQLKIDSENETKEFIKSEIQKLLQTYLSNIDNSDEKSLIRKQLTSILKGANINA